MNTQPSSALRGRWGRDSAGALRVTWHVERAEPDLDTRPDDHNDTPGGVPTPASRTPDHGRRAPIPVAAGTATTSHFVPQEAITMVSTSNTTHGDARRRTSRGRLALRGVVLALSLGAALSACAGGPAPTAALTLVGSSAALPPASAAPAPLAIHRGVVLPPSDEAPKPTNPGPDDALTRLATATVIRSRSVSTVVTVPAGLPVTNRTDISILFGYGQRQTQAYDATNGNRFTFDFDAGDGKRRTEDVAVSYLEHAPTGAVPHSFVAKVPVEAIYDASVGPAVFTLRSDCDFNLAGLAPQDSEPKIHWSDEKGGHTVEFSMRAFQQRTIPGIERSYSGITAKDGKREPVVSYFDELDDLPDIPSPFPVGGTDGDGAPLVPGATHTVNTQVAAVHDSSCIGSWKYTVTVNLQTYSLL
jgi:hypothetical protein